MCQFNVIVGFFILKRRKKEMSKKETSKEIIKEEALFLQEVSTDKNALKTLFQYVNQEFKIFERIPFFVMRSALKKDILHAVYLTDGENVYGYAVYQHIPGYESIHVLYLAILPDYRSLGLGSILLDQLDALSPQGIILEVEDPQAAKTKKELSVCKRRIKFYERNGLYLNKNVQVKDFNYSLLLMSTSALPKLDKLKFEKFYQGLFNRVYQFPVGNFTIKTYFN